MSSICQLMPDKPTQKRLDTVYFVYEAEFHKMEQPFESFFYTLYLVTRGTAEVTLGKTAYSVREGSLFFTYPQAPYYINGSRDFSYMYITFFGDGAGELLEKCGIRKEYFAFQGFERLIEFWQGCIRRINHVNANMLTESVLYYTLSFFHPDEGYRFPPDRNTPAFDNILTYINNNFTDPDLSLRKIADLFSYTEKYLSHLFKKHQGENFNTYLTRRRLAYAKECMDKGMVGIAEIAAAVGYYDPLYFSKVFKKAYGKTPRHYVAERRAQRRAAGSNAE